MADTEFLTPEARAAKEKADAELVLEARLRKGDGFREELVDENQASHEGGMGAQGGAADFGAAGNLAGLGKGSNTP